jgi:hypothetical protein
MSTEGRVYQLVLHNNGLLVLPSGIRIWRGLICQKSVLLLLQSQLVRAWNGPFLRKWVNKDHQMDFLCRQEGEFINCTVMA